MPCTPCHHLTEGAAATALLLLGMLRHRQGPHLCQVLVASLLPPVDAAPAARAALAPLAAARQRLAHQPGGTVILQTGAAG